MPKPHATITNIGNDINNVATITAIECPTRPIEVEDEDDETAFLVADFDWTKSA